MRLILGFMLAAFMAVVPSSMLSQPSRVDYTLRVDTANYSSIAVVMRIHGAPSTFKIGMVAHTEYDDEYWRYLTDLKGESGQGAVKVTREDSAQWRVNAPAGDVTLRYRVNFPATAASQESWKAHLTSSGGLIGGPHSFLYVLGAEGAASSVTLTLPKSWKVATGLTSTGTRTYSADGVEALVDSPMLVGLIRTWTFEIDKVPHRIAFLGRATGVAFDTTRFVSDVERIARETARMFEGRMPYRSYQFLFEDGTFGGLEHRNSVSIGTQSTNLARDPSSYLGQIAHEFFHTWNEVHLRPVTWIGVRNVAPQPTGELWWSEGVTLYYADAILRRAGLATVDSTRVAHLERLMTSYFANPSHGLVSAEQTSRAFNKPPAALGDYTPSMFTQGELIGAMLDLITLDATTGRRSLDDAMRTMSGQFTLTRGFSGGDVERVVRETCGCNVRLFFDAHVRSASPIEFDRWLALVGLRPVVTWAPAMNADSTRAPDVRVSANARPGEDGVQLKVLFPATQWGKAGFHTGDRVDSIGGAAIRDVAQFRAAIGRFKVGDSVRVIVVRDSGRVDKTLVVAGYDRPRVRLEAMPDATAAQRSLLAQWASGR